MLLAQSYEPYGAVLESAGEGASSYGFAAEMRDPTGLIYLRARYLDTSQGRFISKDTWQGDYNRPLSLNGWNYVEADPINQIDPSGMAPECDQFQRADLTQWLVDELNTNREEWIAGIIRTAIQRSHINEDNPFSGELGATAVAYLTFYDVVKTHGLWDFKWEIREKIGRNIQLSGNWYRYDVPANINFGYIGLAVGFDGRTLHCGADFATNRHWCSGADPNEDYEAIEAGYDIWELTRGLPVDENILHFALARHPLIAKGIENEANPKSLSLPWPYPVGSFDDGSSGWWITSRYWGRW